MTNTTHAATKPADWVSLEGKTSMKPLPLISAEKLDTQNGIVNSRNTCQRWILLKPPTLSTSAVPMTALMPSELSQMAGAGSKYRNTTPRYQIR